MNRYLYTALALTGVLLLGMASAAAAENCALSSQYLTLAKARIASHAEDQAATFLEHAIQACPQYQAYELLGELSEGVEDAALEKRGAQAFVNAYRLASTKTERAHTLYEYAKLLDDHGDAQNASPLILRARALDPADAPISHLAARVDSEINHPTTEGLVRGLQDTLYVPLQLATGDEGTGTYSAERTESGAAAELPTGPALNFPINFETNSTAVDPQTRENLRALAEALQSPALKDRRFLFIGYADIRGTQPYNLQLSKERARAIYQQLLQFDPTLAGRVTIIGRGSADPIDPRHTLDAYRENRRLQVLLH